MKFSHTVQFNAVPEWQSYYLAYSSLKKIVYQIEKELFSLPSPTEEIPYSDEASALLSSSARANKIFMPALDAELKKTLDFYVKKEVELYTGIEKLSHRVFVLKSGSINQSSTCEQSGSTDYDTRIDIPDDHSENTGLLQASLLTGSPSKANLFPNPLNQLLSGNHDSNNSMQPSSSKRVSFSREGFDDSYEATVGGKSRNQLAIKAIELFVQLTELKNYVTLNYTGFAKILKKYDKVTGVSLSRQYLEKNVQTSYPYLAASKTKLDTQIQRVHELFSDLRGISKASAFEELKSHLREHLVWERNTVWRDMIGLERKAHAVELKSAPVYDSSTTNSEGQVIQSKTQLSCLSTLTKFRNQFTFVFCLMVFIYLLSIKPFEDPEPNRCLAILTFASLLWATEAIPLFVTALLIPFLIVILQILKSDDGKTHLTAPEATQKVFASMFSPVIMLLLGGFSLASALSKHHIAKKLASMVLSYAGTNPSHVLLANMVVATIASMWISNVAAPVLCFSLIQPLLRTLPSKSSYARSLIIGIALASNIGGMASPISSPQNIIALSNMSPAPSWLQWFAISIPVCTVGTILVWGLLVAVYQPSLNNYTTNQIRYTHEKLTYTQIYVCAVSILTILLWCLAHELESIVGDMGVLAIVPLVLFFGTGVLSKDDFNNFLWTVIILAMGGIALGTGVKSSGLLHIISNQVKLLVSDYSLFSVMVIFCGFTLCVATFISHTVGAVIILPIVAQIGSALPESHSRLLVMGSALMCSSAMGLPVSGFPNMNAIMMEDETGTRYLSVKDFLKVGVPSSFLLYGVICTLGYIILLALQF